VEQFTEGGQRLGQRDFRVGPMNQVEVDVLGLELLKRPGAPRQNIILSELLVTDLRCDKEILTGQPGILNGCADDVVVPIAGGSVDVTVTDFQRVGDGPLAFFALQPKGAEADHRDSAARKRGGRGTVWHDVTPNQHAVRVHDGYAAALLYSANGS